VFVVALYFYHSIVFYKKDFEAKYNVKVDLKNDYIHYYFLVDENPIYVLKKDLLDKYVVWSFDNKKSGLIYPNQQTIADINYISDIQYAAAFKDIYNAKFLSNELNYVTNLSPFWVDIYNFAQLILPVSKSSKIYLNSKIENWYKVIKLWEKGIYFNCDKKKIDNIKNLPDNEFFKIAYSKTWDFYKKNKNPCTNYELPDNLAFNYMYYLKDYKDAKIYYKVAAFHDNVPYWIIWMVSVLNSLSWEHEKAIYMFIQRLKWLETTLKDKSLSDKEYKKLQDYYDLTFRKLQEEFNLYIISQADKEAKDCKKDYKCLWEKGYITREIEKIKTMCRKEDLSNIKSISDITWTTEEVIKKAKCILLSLAFQKWYIQKNKFISPLLNSSFYKYDENRQSWMSYIVK